jgi:hypothetical protein
LYWDEKWFYFEQRVENTEGVASIALSRALVRDPTGIVSPDAVLRAVGIIARSPDPTPAISRWLAAEEMLHIHETVPEPDAYGQNRDHQPD